MHDQAICHFGEVKLTGLKYKETMCLMQVEHENLRTYESGRLCVTNQTFLAVERIQGNFNANGILGLAPVEGERSIVQQMRKQGIISKEIISINYEDPNDLLQQSTIMFGGIDDNQVVNGTAGFTYFSNIGIYEWSLLMNHLHYDGIHTISGRGIHT